MVVHGGLTEEIGDGSLDHSMNTGGCVVCGRKTRREKRNEKTGKGFGYVNTENGWDTHSSFP